VDNFSERLSSKSRPNQPPFRVFEVPREETVPAY